MNLSLPLFDESADAGVAPARLSGVAPEMAPEMAVDATSGPVAGGGDGPQAPSIGLGAGPAELQDPLQMGGAGTDPTAAAPRGAAPEPATLHAALWRASQLGSGRRSVTPSGFAALDAHLPDQGWPHGELTELLLPQPGIGELRLLAPALAAIGGGDARDGQDGRDGPRCVMLFAPPAALSAWALAQQGLSCRHWLVVQARGGAAAAREGRGVHGADEAHGVSRGHGFRHAAPRTPSGLLPLLPSADLLWALEQALRSGQVGAVLAWLPTGLRADVLRRLQLAAQSHDGPVFLFREAQARLRPSAAPLRLGVQPAGVDSLSLRLLKRRGPPLAEPLRLRLPSVLTPHQQARALAQQAVDQAGHAAQVSIRTSGRPSGRSSAQACAQSVPGGVR